MIALVLLVGALVVLALIATEPSRAERHAQAEADEVAAERLFWMAIRR